MPTFRRILKYTPAVVQVLLVVAWVVSVQRPVAVSAFDEHKRGRYVLCLSNGSASFSHTTVNTQPTAGLRVFKLRPHGSGYLGELRHVQRAEGHESHRFGETEFPVLLAVILFLPLAIGPFLSFRFRLWHYLAYTALVAVELAYYLRWQE